MFDTVSNFCDICILCILKPVQYVWCVVGVCSGTVCSVVVLGWIER